MRGPEDESFWSCLKLQNTALKCNRTNKRS